MVSNNTNDPVTNESFEFKISHLRKFNNNMDAQCSYFCLLAKHMKTFFWYFSFHYIPLMIEGK